MVTLWSIALIMVMVTSVLWTVSSSHDVLLCDTGSYDAGIISSLHTGSSYDVECYALAVLVVLQELVALYVVPGLLVQTTIV